MTRPACGRRSSRRGLLFVGTGVPGGEEGARRGPSIMVGGSEASDAPIRALIEGIAAASEGALCAARVGPDGAGHVVETAHDGIEYADGQMIADVHGLMRDGGGMAAPEMAATFGHWNEGPLASFPVGVTAAVLAATDRAGGPAVDAVVDSAGQKGTGCWTLIEALKLGQSARAIEAAVAARARSADRDLRMAGAEALALDGGVCEMPEDAVPRAALTTAEIVADDQGLRLLASVSAHFGWDPDLARIAEVWRAGCIIRSDMLDDIAAAARGGMPHGALVPTEAFLPRVRAGLPALRETICAAASGGIAVPALGAALAYLKTRRRGRGTATLTQTQRDCFGRHGYRRLDGAAAPHGPWWEDEGGRRGRPA